MIIVMYMLVLQGSDIFENLSVKEKQRACVIIQRSIFDTDYPSFYK